MTTKKDLRYAVGRGFTRMSLFGSSILLVLRLLLDGIKMNYSESLNNGQKLVSLHFNLDRFDFLSLYIYCLFLALMLGIDNYTLGKLLENIPVLREFAQKMGGVRGGERFPLSKDDSDKGDE
ncbi:hypothetical protein [Argonema galeatum]|uniref:hypothetical protein n=1 Tax=Argonema galeatum TaxID=2942762 RepID=UPI0020119D41|nr:hypothetical protein [Argonema galeatum]MCL1468682.1 hypothetical protein [Argonema galeatum A003/A1]